MVIPFTISLDTNVSIIDSTRNHLSLFCIIWDGNVVLGRITEEPVFDTVRNMVVFLIVGNSDIFCIVTIVLVEEIV